MSMYEGVFVVICSGNVMPVCQLFVCCNVMNVCSIYVVIKDRCVIGL